MTIGRTPGIAGSDTTVAAGAMPVSAAGRERFFPGAMVAGRYRIVALLGQGGMGEVYRAEDLKLGQAVALKFLPEGVERDPALLARLLGEVKLARQVSHPNICRVHDIVEADGRHFISMEFVDGEDLASLLRRVGYLPKERAIRVARELCAGLAAAHDQKILHRDLKPANVMLDGRGRARITDFGLAIGAGEAAGAEVLSGTPAYMAPEQRAGAEVTARSDVYALGLVLHELFTGKPAFDAQSIEALAYLQSQGPAHRPSELVADFDPDVERTILACLAPDASERPASALQVAASLPGGDPHAVVVAPGETPSPEMVAAAGGKGALSPRTAWALFAVSVTALVAIQALSPIATDFGLARWTKPAPVLAERAREIAASLGYERNPTDSDAQIVIARQALKYMAQGKPQSEWRKQIARWGPSVALQYRQSPRPMVPANFGWRVAPEDPPLSVTGMVSVSLDATGRLTGFVAVPPQHDTTAASASSFDWAPLFLAAGLDPGRFVEVTPSWVPAVAFDRRAAWTGTSEWDPAVPLQLSAASWRGRPVSFQVRGPWSKPTRMEPLPTTALDTIGGAFTAIVFLAALGGLVLLARWNLRKGRGDRRGAFRLALVSMTLLAVGVALNAHKPPDFQAMTWILLQILMVSIAVGVATGILYLAVEPFVRRRMPELMIGWARLLEGRARDPRVGRDLLAGGVIALCAAVVRLGLRAAPLPGQETLPILPDVLQGGVQIFAYFATLVGSDLISASIFLLGFYVVLLLVLRRAAVAIPVFGLVMSINMIYPGPLGILNGLAYGALITLTTARFGLLSVAGFGFVFWTLLTMPWPVDPGAAYGPQSVILLLVLLAYFAWALRVSVGPRPLFRLALDE